MREIDRGRGGRARRRAENSLRCPTFVFFSSTLSTTGSRMSVFVIMLSFQYKLHFSRWMRGWTVKEMVILS